MNVGFSLFVLINNSSIFYKRRKPNTAVSQLILKYDYNHERLFQHKGMLKTEKTPLCFLRYTPGSTCVRADLVRTRPLAEYTEQ